MSDHGFTFRPGTSDENVFKDVVENNEYHLGEFSAEDVIVDIGAHIGSFSWAAFQRGSRRVIAFEPDQENFCLLRYNLREFMLSGACVAMPVAVGKAGLGFEIQSDYPEEGTEINTGGAYLLSVGNIDRPRRPRHLVPRIGFDEIVTGFNLEKIRLLKLDCEFSEWILLRTSIRLDIVQEIVGEYHCSKSDNPDTLRAILEDKGFQSEITPHDNSIGLFRAFR